MAIKDCIILFKVDEELRDEIDRAVARSPVNTRSSLIRDVIIRPFLRNLEVQDAIVSSESMEAFRRDLRYVIGLLERLNLDGGLNAAANDNVAAASNLEDDVQASLLTIRKQILPVIEELKRLKNRLAA